MKLHRHSSLPFTVFSQSSSTTVEGFHTKGWSNIQNIFSNFFDFSGRNIVLKGPESFHTKNFIKIPIGKKFGKIR
jgi:hypothetical protein